MLCKFKKTPEDALFNIIEGLQIENYKKTVLQERYLSVLRNFHTRASRLSIMFYTSRLIVTVGSILVPAFLSIQASNTQTEMYWATWIISLSVTIFNGFITLFKIDKKYFFINTTLEMLRSEGWQYIGLSGRYSGKDPTIPSTHENQFLVFFHMAEKIKMRQVEEEYWKFTDPSDIGNATSQKLPLLTPTPVTQLNSLQADQKNMIERWFEDIHANKLGLQPRSSKLLNKVDGRQASSGIPEPSTETPVSVSDGVSVESSPGKTVVQVSSGKTVVQVSSGKSEEIPKNTILTVMQDESDVWSGTNSRS